MKKIFFVMVMGLAMSSFANAQSTFNLQGNWLMESGVCLKKDGSQQIDFQYNRDVRPMTEARFSLDGNGVGRMNVINFGESSQCSETAEISMMLQDGKLVYTHGPISWSGDRNNNGCNGDQVAETATLAFTSINAGSFQIHMPTFGELDECIDRWMKIVRQ